MKRRAEGVRQLYDARCVKTFFAHFAHSAFDKRMRNEDSPLDSLLDRMWNDYIRLNPSAGRIHAAITARGEKVINDHIAFRTVQHPRLGIDHLGRIFERFGYRKMRCYEFTEKKLLAWHYEHGTEPSLPKIFISELLLERFSPFCKETLNRLIDSIPASELSREDFPIIGRPWQLTHEEYLKLASESEYASWVAAFGFRPNHFTVLVNELKTFSGLPDVNAFVKSLGFVLNSSGGEIKGTPLDLLEQSSTMAEPVSVEFSNRSHPVPACYYEFALRHRAKDGKLYTGFVATSADKIFESTNRR